MATTAREDGDPTSGRALTRADNPLVRAVGRVRATVLTKLLVAFVGTVILLVVLGALAFQVIGQSNGRVVELKKLQQHAAAYRQLQADGAFVQQLLNLRAGGCAFARRELCDVTPLELPSAASRLAVDGVIIRVLAGFAKATDPCCLGVTPSPDEQHTIRIITQEFAQLSAVMNQIAVMDQLGQIGDVGAQLLHSEAQPLGALLTLRTRSLAESTQKATDAVIGENGSASAASQNLIVGVSAGSIALALLLGYLLSLSIVVPVRRMQTRLAGIARGDFSGQVEVANRDELGALAGSLNRMNDELRRLYGELESASRHKSEFLATMSHELRTPLNAIIGFSQVLKEQMYGDLNAKQADYVDDVLSSGQHLLNLINDILDLAKVEAGRMELQPTTFALPGVLDNAMSMVRERAIRQGVGLTATVAPPVGLLEADERKVKQILFNLLSNAVKFTPSGGQVTLAASVVDDQIEISVRDTGLGINAEDQVRIFEEFYQVGRAKTQEGTGLGLALTRRLVELHHGRLSVESKPGIGSAFTVTLPLHQPGVAGEIAPAAATEPVSL